MLKSEDYKKVCKWIIMSREEGVSVIEISRALHWKANTVYDILRGAGALDPIPRKRYYGRESDDLHGRFLDSMKRVGLSPERWAWSWGYYLPEVIDYTSESADLNDFDVKMLHKALSRDFSREYLAIYKRQPAAPIDFPKNPCATYVAKRDASRRQFIAYVKELEDYEDHPVARGSTPSEAIANLEAMVALFMQQVRLNFAILHVRKING